MMAGPLTPTFDVLAQSGTNSPGVIPLDFLFGRVSLKRQRDGTVQESVKKPASLISPGNRLLAGLVMLMIA